MDNRLTFLYWHMPELRGRRRGRGAGRGKTGTSGGPSAGGKSPVWWLAVTWSELEVAKPLCPHCQEKPLLRMCHPYRKPTQVDEERILRPAGEALLRNSAK